MIVSVRFMTFVVNVMHMAVINNVMSNLYYDFSEAMLKCGRVLRIGALAL